MSENTPRELTDGMRAGVILMTVCAALSTGAVSILLVHIFTLGTATKQDHNGERVFFRMQLGVFLVNLLFCDLCQAISGLIQGHWAVARAVQPGTLCTTQAVLLLFGDLGTAVWNSIIAIHTFVTIVLRISVSRTWAFMAVLGGWLIACFYTVVGPLILADDTKGPFFGVAYQWCFVRAHYRIDRVMVLHVPMLFSGLLILILYFMVFLNLRGLLVVEGWRFHFHWDAAKLRQKLGNPPVVHNEHMKAVSRKVLWYPLVYLAIILPLSVCRFATLNDPVPGTDLEESTIPNPVWFVSMCLLFSMGAADSVVYTMTRRIGNGSLFRRSSTRVVQIYIDHVTHRDPESPKISRDRKLRNSANSANSTMTTIATPKAAFRRLSLGQRAIIGRDSHSPTAFLHEGAESPTFDLEKSRRRPFSISTAPCLPYISEDVEFSHGFDLLSKPV